MIRQSAPWLETPVASPLSDLLKSSFVGGPLAHLSLVSPIVAVRSTYIPSTASSAVSPDILAQAVWLAATPVA